MVIALEVISTLLPAVGFILTLPISIVTYAVQGILAGYFLKRDARFSTGPGSYARQGAISAFWTGIVISSITTILLEIILAPLTAGFSLVGIPSLLLSGLGDGMLNLALTTSFAWLFGRYGMRWSAALSCAVAALGLAFVSCIGLGAIGLVLAALRPPG